MKLSPAAAALLLAIRATLEGIVQFFRTAKILLKPVQQKPRMRKVMAQQQLRVLAFYDIFELRLKTFIPEDLKRDLYNMCPLRPLSSM